MGLCCSSHSSPLDNSSSLHLWATTGVEGLLTWDWGAACDEADAEGGLGPSSLAADGVVKKKKKRRHKQNKKGNKKGLGGDGGGGDGGGAEEMSVE